MARPSIISHVFTGNAFECENAIKGDDLVHNGHSFSSVEKKFSNSKGSIYIADTTAFTDYLRKASFALYPEQTVDMWFKLDANSITNTTMSKTGSSVFIMRSGGSGDNRSWTSFAPGSGFSYNIVDSIGGVYSLFVTTASISADTWTHYRVCHSFANQRMKIFINGVEVGDRAATLNIVLQAGQTQYFGTDNQARTGFSLLGWIDGIICRSEYDLDFKDINKKRRYMNDYVL